MIIRIYYLSSCNECKNLLQVIFNEGIQRMFVPVCLDNSSSEDLYKIMTSLKIDTLPTIVISSENQQPMIFEGPQQCSQWLTNFTLNRRKNIVQVVDNQRRLIQKAQMIARNQDGTDGFIEAEMDGISDTYSYNLTEIGQPKNYVMVGDEDKYNIVTPQLKEGKIDDITLRKQMAELENNRNNDKRQLMQIMEQNQIKAVMNIDNF